MLRPPPDDAAAVVEVDAKDEEVGLLRDVGGDEVLDRVEVMLVLNVDDANDVLLELELGEVEEATAGVVMLML